MKMSAGEVDNDRDGNEYQMSLNLRGEILVQDVGCILVGGKTDLQERAKIMNENLGSDENAVRKVGCCGSEPQGKNVDVEATQGAQKITEGKEHVNSVFQCTKIVDLPFHQIQELSVQAVNMKERTRERFVGQMADVPVIPQERIRQCIVAEIQGTTVSHIQEQIDEVVKAISSERIVARVAKEIEVIQVLPIMEEVTETRQRSTVTRTRRTR